MPEAALTLVSKRCPKCGETKPLSEFHRNASRKDGHAEWCKPCALAAIKATAKRRRERIGDEAYRAERREATRRSRAKPLGRVRDRANSEAYSAALFALRDAHRGHFFALLARERYERGLT